MEINLNSVISEMIEIFNIQIKHYKLYDLKKENILSVNSLFSYLKSDIHEIIEYLFFMNTNVVSLKEECSENQYKLFLMFYTND